MKQENVEEWITTYRKYPDIVKSDFDKILFDIVQFSTWDMTLTQIRNEVYVKIVNKFCGVNNIEEILNNWKEKGIISELPKQSNIKVWKIKKVDDTTNQSTSLPTN